MWELRLAPMGQPGPPDSVLSQVFYDQLRQMSLHVFSNEASMALFRGWLATKEASSVEDLWG